MAAMTVVEYIRRSDNWGPKFMTSHDDDFVSHGSGHSTARRSILMEDAAIYAHSCYPTVTEKERYYNDET